MLAAARPTKRSRRPPRTLVDDLPREQHVAGECPRCGAARVVTPCPTCPAWFIVCDCLAGGVPLYETFVADDRCPRCRRASARAARYERSLDDDDSRKRED